MTFKRVTITKMWILNERQPAQSSLQGLPWLLMAASLFQLNLVEPFSFFRLFPLGAHHCSDHQKHLRIVVPVYLTISDGEPKKFGLLSLLLSRCHAVTGRYRITAFVAFEMGWLALPLLVQWRGMVKEKRNKIPYQKFALHLQVMLLHPSVNSTIVRQLKHRCQRSARARSSNASNPLSAGQSLCGW